MRITSGQTIVGVPAADVRRFLRLRHELYMYHAERMFGAAATDVVEGLIAEGYLERGDAPSDFESPLVKTIKGYALEGASASPPVKRATAQRNLDQLLARIGVLNGDTDGPMYVTRAVLFGSFLDETRDRVADVDVAIDCDRRRKLTELELRTAVHHQSYGRRMPKMPAEVFNDRDVRWFLKGGSRVLSPVDYEQHAELLATCPHRQIFPLGTVE